MRINSERLWLRLMAMAKIGAINNNGVNRQALSCEEHQSWVLMAEWARLTGLEIRTDEAANLFICCPGADRELPPLLLGSHLDSQPTGGRFDGVYGVLAALEVLCSYRDHGITPRCDLMAVAWMNEEGSRFAPGMMGSSWFAGSRSIESIRAVRDQQGMSAGEAIDQMHHMFPEFPLWRPSLSPAGYLEVHIEQATVLENHQAIIGAVTGIQGKHTWQVTIQGESGHAGTVPMKDRQDSLAIFSQLATSLYQQVGGFDSQVMFTIGWLEVLPNAPSVIPQQVSFRIDLRHPHPQHLRQLADLTEQLLSGVSLHAIVNTTRLSEAAPNTFDPQLQQWITDSAEQHGWPVMPVLSAAGHDARYLSEICPSAMIFIPCRAGISHSPEEWAEPEHVAAGAQVLADVIGNMLAGMQ